MESVMKPQMEGQIDIRSDRLIRNTPQRVGGMKPLNDSCYLKPDQNYRVIQDNDPIKNRTWRKAFQRNE